MIITNVYWTPIVNMITVKCDCGNTFDWQTNISLIHCPKCYHNEWWHGGHTEDVYKIAKMELKDKEISDEIKDVLFKEINTTIDNEIIKSINTGEENDLIPMK